MSLDLSQLQCLAETGDGGQQARCPACAELGHDRKGEHLRIYADGRFGCCVHPKDREHRKRIFALAGDRQPQTIRVKMVQTKTRAPIQSGVLGRLGRLFESQTEESDPTADILGTAGTPFFYLRAHTREEDISMGKLKEFETPVPSVPTDEHDSDGAEAVPSVPDFPPPKSDRPHLLADGTLVIPFQSPERYHWWKGGQSVAQTLAELHPTGKESDGSPF